MDLSRTDSDSIYEQYDGDYEKYEEVQTNQVKMLLKLKDEI